jgi:hypothetical protein
MRAFRDAQHICIGWRLDRLRDPGFERRMAIFHGPGWDDLDEWGQTFDAATYPQSVGLARLLATPYWRGRILDKGWPWHDEFVAELRRTVAPDYILISYPRIRRRHHRDDPLLEWRQHIRLLEFQPLPSDHPASLPETIDGKGSAADRAPKAALVELSQIDEAGSPNCRTDLNQPSESLHHVVHMR